MTKPSSNLLRFREDTQADHTAVSFGDFSEQSNASAVRIEPGDDVRELLPQLEQLALVEVSFPVFGDGRGYSSARILREAGYTGELRAVGDVLVDQIAYLKRCGFDAFDPDQPLDSADVEAALSRFPEVYQAAADGARFIGKLRHG
jgi:uncharacterized protein (DUF934 family)